MHEASEKSFIHTSFEIEEGSGCDLMEGYLKLLSAEVLGTVVTAQQLSDGC